MVPSCQPLPPSGPPQDTTGTHLHHRFVSFLHHGLHLLSRDVTSPLPGRQETLDENRTKLLDLLNGVGLADGPEQLVQVLQFKEHKRSQTGVTSEPHLDLSEGGGLYRVGILQGDVL